MSVCAEALISVLFPIHTGRRHNDWCVARVEEIAIVAHLVYRCICVPSSWRLRALYRRTGRLNLCLANTDTVPPIFHSVGGGSALAWGAGHILASCGTAVAFSSRH